VTVRRALVILCALLCGTSCGPARASAAPGEGTVVAVVDGDTVRVHLGSGTETVRLLGIDTPETVHPTKPVQCFGPEASARTKALLPKGTVVRLERDVEARDRYGRLLAYVRRSDGTFVNLALVEEGYARTLTIAPNGAYADDFAAAARGARDASRGLWRACAQEGGDPATHR
jgi:micrococcal nuclease